METFEVLGLHDKYYREYSQLVILHAERCQAGSKLNLRRQSFPIRIAKVWNELPDSVANSPNVNTFKNRLDRHLRGEDFLCTTTKHPYQDTGHLAEDRAKRFEHVDQLRPTPVVMKDPKKT